MQVVGIAQLDLAAHFLQVLGTDAALDGRLGAHIHEYGCLHHTAVGTGELAAPGAALGLDDFEHTSLSLYQIIAVPARIQYKNMASPKEKNR